MLPSAQREAQEAEGLKDMLKYRVEKACSAAGFWNASGDNLVFFSYASIHDKTFGEAIF